MLNDRVDRIDSRTIKRDQYLDEWRFLLVKGFR
jgi:hypothetical protein